MTLHPGEAFARAEQLMSLHLSTDWKFAFDRAKRRAGSCSFGAQRITVSQYFIAQASLAEFDQVMLHEIAHALAGPNVGHGAEWRRIAKQIGYTGQRTIEGNFAAAHAPWVGICPKGHEHVRYRMPTRVSSCAECHPSFHRGFVIEWARRSPKA